MPFYMMASTVRNLHAFPVQYGKAAIRPEEKLRLGSEFEYVRRTGSGFRGRFIIMSVSSSPGRKLRFGIICGKKISGKAVVRNRAKRLIRESFRLIKSRVQPSYLIFVARKMIISKSLRDVQGEMIELITKAGLWTKETE